MKLFKKNIYEDYIYNGFKKTVIIMSIIFILFGTIAYFNKLYFKNIKIDDSIKDGRRLKTAFLFHLNQSITPYADVGDRASYNRLIKTLRKHKNLKFNLHISGTLIQSLLWYNPETIDLIRAGVKDGQFEILGSTYSQNLLYSTDNESNQLQIKRHKEIIKDVLGVTPIGFWNAERTWNQKMAEIITENGYKYTFIEDKTMKKSGSSGSEYFVRSTAQGELFIVNDDNEFLEKINSAVDAGDLESNIANRGALLNKDRKEYKKLFKYMRDIYNKDSENKFILNYADDGEITGLWDFEKGSSTEWDFKNLDYLLGEIENKKWIETIKYSDYVTAEIVKEDITPIKDGAAIWMEKAARGYGNYSEKGYKSWFDFNTNSPKIAYYKKQYEIYLDKLKKMETEKDIRILNLYKLAKENYLVHQFEYGCTGVSGTDEQFKNGDRFGMWENIRFMNIYFDAAENITDYQDKIYEKDVNGDGIDEIVVIKGDNYYVISKKFGGRVLYWFDLSRGIELLGGEVGVQLDERYYNGNKYLEPYSFKDFMQYSNDNSIFIKYFENKKYYVRTGGLNDNLIYSTEEINGGGVSDIYDTELKIEEKKLEKVVFLRDKFIKEIKFTDKGIEVSYNIPENSAGIIVRTEVNPDYYSIINQGKKVIEISKNESELTIYNSYSKIGIKIEGKYAEKIITDESLMGIIAETEFEIKKPVIKIEKYFN